MPSSDQTPEEAQRKMNESIKALEVNAPSIAHLKMTYFRAYLAEGFNDQQALKLTKNISQI